MLELVRRRQPSRRPPSRWRPGSRCSSRPTAPSRRSATTGCCSSTRPSRTSSRRVGRAPGSRGRASRSGSCCSARRSSSLTGWRGFALTELVVLALTAAVALQAIRGIYWFSIACLIILPPAIDRAVGFREPPPLRSVGRVVSLIAVTGLVIAAIAGGLTTGGRVADNWPASAAVPVRARPPRSCDARLPHRPLRRLAALDDSRASGPPRVRRAIRGLHPRPDGRQRPLQRRDGQGLEDASRTATASSRSTTPTRRRTCPTFSPSRGRGSSTATQTSRSSIADHSIEGYWHGETHADSPSDAVRSRSGAERPVRTRPTGSTRNAPEPALYVGPDTPG